MAIYSTEWRTKPGMPTWLGYHINEVGSGVLSIQRDGLGSTLHMTAEDAIWLRDALDKHAAYLAALAETTACARAVE